jgi:acyl-CoA hydrolase
VAVNSDFKATLVYGDIVIIKLSIKKIGKSSVVFGYRIRRKRDSELCFTADCNDCNYFLGFHEACADSTRISDLIRKPS